MGLGGEKGRPRAQVVGAMVAIAIVVSMTLSASSARAEGTSNPCPIPPTHLPIVCSRPLGEPSIDNPACTSSSPTPAIYGIVYIDTNGNGVYEPGDPPDGWDVPVEGSEVILRRADGTEPLSAIPTDGYYCFEGLHPGEYTITVTLRYEDELVLHLLDEEPDGIHLQPDGAIACDFRYERRYQPPPGPTYTLSLPMVTR